MHLCKTELQDVVAQRDESLHKERALEVALQEQRGESLVKERALEESLEEARAPDRREHDRRILRQIIEQMPRQLVRSLTEHDFGGSWGRELVMPVHRIVDELDDVEHRFLDSALVLCLSFRW
jgi:hypothetical protein